MANKQLPTNDNVTLYRKTFGSVVLKRVKKAGSDLMNKVPTKSVSMLENEFETPLEFN